MRVGGIVGRAGLCGWRDCVLAGLPTRIARRGIAGLQDCRIAGSGLSGLPTGGIAWQVGLPHAGLPVMGLLLAGFLCRIACVGLRVCRRL